jgi:hypothetical protein
MISFNEKDFFITTIKQASGLDRMHTKRYYRIHGLKSSNPKSIHIKYSSETLPYTKVADITETFRKHLPKQIFDKLCFESVTDRKKIFIGLHKDIRENIKLSAAILKTIIFIIEERINKVQVIN